METCQPCKLLLNPTVHGRRLTPTIATFLIAAAIWIELDDQLLWSSGSYDIQWEEEALFI